MLEVTSVLLKFGDFINENWNSIKFFLSPDNVNYEYDDWLQANWEILVETKICEPGQFLYHYGEGADCYGEFSRVSYYNKTPTHKIVGKLANDQCYDYYSREVIKRMENFNFYRFINVDDEMQDDNNPPFDYCEFVHDIEDKRIWLSKPEVQFFMVPWT
jgi:hypothetical protein